MLDIQIILTINTPNSAPNILFTGVSWVFFSLNFLFDFFEGYVIVEDVSAIGKHQN